MSIVVDRNFDVVVREFGMNVKVEGAGEVGFDRYILSAAINISIYGGRQRSSYITWGNSARCNGDFTKPSSFRALLTSGMNMGGRYHSRKKQECGRECQLHCE